MHKNRFFWMAVMTSMWLTQPALAQDHNHEPGAFGSGQTDAACADPLKQEKLDRAKQIENSPPAGAPIQTGLPVDGKILTAPSQKKSAGLDASNVVPVTQRQVIPASTPAGRPTIALALGGGGARGAAHIGVLRVLEREGIPVDYIVGTSMGAAVGGMYASGLSLDRITALLEDGSFRHAYMPTPLVPQILGAPLSELTLHHHYAGIYCGKKFTKYLEAVLPRADMDIKDSKIPYAAVAVNLIDGKAYSLTEGSLATAIKASAALTPLIQPVAIADKVFIDGGVRANMPIISARETGAGIVIAVMVDEPLVPVPAKRFVHFKGIGSRMADIVLATSDERQLEFADIVINPDISNIPIISKHDREDAERAIKVGEMAAEKALPEIRRRLNLSARSRDSVAKVKNLAQ